VTLYQRLNFKDIPLHLDKVKSQEQAAKFGPNFFEYKIADNKYLKETLNQLVEFTISPDIVNVTQITYPGAVPHTDAWNVGLNYYFDVGDDTTFYFKQLDKNINPTAVRETNVRTYDLKNLAVVDKFKANRNEWYLINTTVPHAVKCQNPGTVRTMLRFVWYKYDFDTILKSINIKD